MTMTQMAFHLKHMPRLSALSSSSSSTSPISSSLLLPFTHHKSPLSSSSEAPEEATDIETTILPTTTTSLTPSETTLLDKFHSIIKEHHIKNPNPTSTDLTVDFTIPSLSTSFSALSPPPLSPSLLHHLIRRCAAPSRAAHFPQTLALFKWWVSSSIPASDDISSAELADPFNDMIDFAGKARRFHLVWSLLDAMRAGGVPITLDTFARIVRRYACAGLLSDAVHAFRRMEDYGCPCDLAAFSATITLLSKNSAADAVTFFDQHKNQFPPDVVVYTTLIHACCRANRTDEVERLFNEMKVYGITPKGYTYTIVVGALCCAGKNAIVDKVLAQMLDSSGARPNVAPFNAMMREYVKMGCSKNVFELYNKMLQLGCKPDVITYNFLIDSHCRQNNLDGAMEVLDLMIMEKCVPDAFSFNPMFNFMLKLPGVTCVQKLYSRMRNLNCKPNAITYNLLMQKFKKDDEALLKLLKEMDEEGVESNLNTYNLTITFLCRMGYFNWAYRQLCEMMEVKNLKPSEALYRMVLRGLMKAGERNKLKQVVEKLRKRGLRTHPF